MSGHLYKIRPSFLKLSGRLLDFGKAYYGDENFDHEAADFEFPLTYSYMKFDSQELVNAHIERVRALRAEVGLAPNHEDDEAIFAGNWIFNEPEWLGIESELRNRKIMEELGVVDRPKYSDRPTWLADRIKENPEFQAKWDAAQSNAAREVTLTYPGGLKILTFDYPQPVVDMVFEWMDLAAEDPVLIAHNRCLETQKENILRTPKPYTTAQKMNEWEIAQMDRYIPEFAGVTSKWYEIEVSEESIIFVTDLLKLASYLELHAMMDSIALVMGRMNEFSTINVLSDQPVPAPTNEEHHVPTENEEDNDGGW